MRIAICEDTLQDMERVLDLCERYAALRGYEAQYLHYGETASMLADPAVREADIMLLDIMMQGEDGMTAAGVALARQLRLQGYTGAIIFTTSSLDYYREGFEVDAAHYLVKPLSYEAVEAALDRAMRWVGPPRRIITVPVNRLQVTIAHDQIRYVEVFGHETLLHTETDALRVLLPLSRLEKMLEGDPFLRCYRSYIINMDYVKAMEEDRFILEGGAIIPISLRSRQAYRERYLRYRLAQV